MYSLLDRYLINSNKLLLITNKTLKKKILNIIDYRIEYAIDNASILFSLPKNLTCFLITFFSR